MHLFRPLVAVACLWLAGCAHNVAYRVQPASATPCQETDQRDCRAAIRHPLRSGPDGAYITYVEFDDQGALHDRARTRQALDLLRERTRQRATLLVLFAHGWKHNAEVGDENVRDFQALLVKLRANLAAYEAEHQIPPERRRQVEGVYLGWRGLSTKWEPGKELTFWRRKATAHRIGTDGAIEIISELSALRSQPAANGGRHALVIAGHSFGGALVYNATEHLLMRELVEAQQCVPAAGAGEPQLKIAPFSNTRVESAEGVALQEDACKPVPASVADMVILVNPAFENTRYDPLEARSRQIPFARGQMPILAVFMSEKDKATRYAFPAGRFFSTLTNNYADQGQRKRDLVALGHLKEKWTHTLDVPDRTRQLLGIQSLMGMKTLGQIADAIRPNYPGWDDFICGNANTWSLDGVELKRYADSTPAPDPHSPYMVVRVKGKLVNGHSKIWGEAFNGFVENLVTARFAGGSEMSCQGGRPTRVPQ